MNKHLIAIGALLLISSCSNDSHEINARTGEVTSAISAGSDSEKELQKALKEIDEEESKKLEKEKSTATTLAFDRLSHDFGKVMAESENKTEFIVTNTGENPLILSDVSASCGCTMPKKPEAPIPPGKSDTIKVVFQSKPGQMNEIKKTITVTANTEERIHLLEIKAFVR